MEQVIQKVQESDDDEMLSENGEGERDTEEDKLWEWLKTFPADNSFNRALFEDIGREILRPVIRQYSSCTEDVQSLERSKGKMHDLLVFIILNRKIMLSFLFKLHVFYPARA